MRKKTLPLLLLVVYFWKLPLQAQAQANTPPPIVITPVVGFSTLQQAISTILGFVILAAALITFGYMLFGAYKYITAGDSASNTAAARQTIQNALIGLVLLGTIYVIFKFVVNIIPGLGQFFG